MKPLIFTFFAMILVYSLFIDKKEDVDLRVPASMRTVQTSMPDSTNINDSVVFFANRSLKLENEFDFN